MSKTRPTHAFTGAYGHVLVGLSTGPDLQVIRNGEPLDLPEGTTLELEPGDAVIASGDLEHPLLEPVSGRKRKTESEPSDAEAEDHTEEEPRA